MEARFVGAMLGTMVGDALGLPVEGIDSRELAELLARHPTLPRGEREVNAAVFGLIMGDPVLPGSARYSDDTQMTIGVAQSLIARPDFDGADMAHRFAENFEPGRGYGMGAQVVLNRLRHGAAWNEAGGNLFGGQGSWGNGAAMRAAPVGLLFQHDPEALRRVADAQAAITHTHPLGRGGAVLQAAAVAVAAGLSPGEALDPLTFLDAAYALAGDLPDEYHQSLADMRLILRLRLLPAEVGETLGNGVEAHRSVPAALFAFATHPETFEGAVLYAVQGGGDTDTIAAMCGAIAGAYHGADAIPAAWLAALENGQQGREYVRSLAHDLYTVWTGRG